MIWNADHTKRQRNDVTVGAFLAAVRRPGCSSLDATGQAVCGDFVDRSTR